MLPVLCVLCYSCLTPQKAVLVTIQEVPVKLDYDVVRDVGRPPLVYTERTLASADWRVTLVNGDVLVTLQRLTVNANDIEFRELVRKSELSCLRVGAETAKAMHIARWVGIQLIPESVYSALIGAVVADASVDVMEKPFTECMESVMETIRSDPSQASQEGPRTA